MKIVLLTTIILTIAPVWVQGRISRGNSKKSKLPCQETSNSDAYEIFAQKHIVDDLFDRNSVEEWKKYLKKKKLCGRTPIQSFIEDKDEESIKQICQQSGWRLKDVKGYKNIPGNLCISMEKITVYNVESIKSNGCKVTKAKADSQFVVVACNQIMKNVCRPVHFVAYKIEHVPDDKTCQI